MKQEIETLAILMTIAECIHDVLETKDRALQELKLAQLGLHVNEEAKKILDRIQVLQIQKRLSLGEIQGSFLFNLDLYFPHAGYDF